jgi:hypothetical protein
MKVLAALSIGVLGAPLGNAKPVSAAKQDPVTAIDILLEPDETMIEKATAANQRLVKAFPEGFALDETHTPHISVLQRYVKTADLNKVYEAVGRVLAAERPASWELKAYRHCRPVHGGYGNRGGIPHHHRRFRHQPADDRLRGALCAGRNWRQVQAARNDRLGPSGLPERPSTGTGVVTFLMG